jgi:hypothetical protein
VLSPGVFQTAHKESVQKIAAQADPVRAEEVGGGTNAADHISEETLMLILRYRGYILMSLMVTPQQITLVLMLFDTARSMPERLLRR